MRFITKIVSALVVLLLPSIITAGSPIFTLTAKTPTNIQLLSSTSATVQYTVQNNSRKPHTLMLVPMQGITQVTTSGNCPNPFILGTYQSCTLTLQISGSQLTHDLHGGPTVCQQGTNGNPSPFLCYQPATADSLNITFIPLAQYSITSTAGANGAISPSGPQTVYSGSNLLFTATPNPNYLVYQWFVDGSVAQTGGSTFLLSNITANHSVSVMFTDNSLFYAAGENGRLYYSFNAGLAWSATPLAPAGNYPINSVFATNSTLYVGTENGFLYYSTNNGASWSNSSSPDDSAVNSVFVSDDVIFAGTANGFVYYSTDNGSSWDVTTSPDTTSVNAVFIYSNTIYVGTSFGSVYYSTNNGISWTSINGQPDGSPIHNIFISDNTIYVNTQDEFVYSSASLTGGGSWTTIAQTVYSLFVNSAGSALYAGTQGGYVYAVTEGTELGFITYTPINSLYVLEG